MEFRGHDVRIEQGDTVGAKVFIDGKELKGVREVSYRNGVGEIPIITVEFIPQTLNKKEKLDLKAQITVDGNMITDKVIEAINEQIKREYRKGVVL